jgi:hypothetical protein
VAIGDKGIKLSKAERAARVKAFRTADRELQEYDGPGNAGLYSDEDPTYVRLNGKVNELWTTVPWWWRTAWTN